MNPRSHPTRRSFFRGMTLGTGGVLLAPYLNSLEAGEVTDQKPLRVVFFLQGNGVYPREVQPEAIPREKMPERFEDRDLTGVKLPMSLEPLAPFQDRMTLIQGLSGRVCGPPSHSCGFGALGCYPERKGPMGETIDAAIAKALPGIFPHVGLGVQNRPERGVIYNVSAWEKNKALPTQCHPLQAHRRLFASAAEGEDRAKFDARTNVLDFLADDVRRLQTRVNTEERRKLDSYLDAFESMSDRQSALNRSRDRIGRHAPDADDGYGSETQVFERLEAQFEIAAGAILSGLTNVVTISSGSGLGFSGISPNGKELGLGDGEIGSHGIGHGGSFLGKSSSELHALIRRRHLKLLAGFLRKLEAIPEGDGSMLDNTVVVYTSDHGDSHHPNCREWPFVLVGDLGGRLKTRGRYLGFPYYGKPGHRTTANLYTALLQAVGERRNRFGLPDIAIRDLDQDGPLTEILA